MADMAHISGLVATGVSVMGRGWGREEIERNN